MTRRLIPHIDDIGNTLGSIVSMAELGGAGFVTSGSVMVPAPWFPAAAELAVRRPELDFGVHLTLTSESAACRWAPVSTRSHASGLLDDDGYFWPTAAEVAARADPAAVDEELRAQLEMALDAGIDVTHVDHHMGAALLPRFAATTAKIAEDYRIPMVFPADISGYFTVLNMGASDVAALKAARKASHAIAEVDFLIGLEHMDEDPADLYRSYVSSTGSGRPTFLSLHCNPPGEVTQVHPKDAAWRIAEDALFRRADFVEWVAAQEVELVDFRSIRALLRSNVSG